MNSFLQLGLAEPIARALVEEKYADPTPIQAQTIPQVLAARDVVGIAQTGTGKTAAFALPILHHLSNNRHRLEKRTCRVLVLSPTRELSAQIVDSFETYGRHVRPRVALAIFESAFLVRVGDEPHRHSPSPAIGRKTARALQAKSVWPFSHRPDVRLAEETAHPSFAVSARIDRRRGCYGANGPRGPPRHWTKDDARLASKNPEIYGA